MSDQLELASPARTGVTPLRILVVDDSPDAADSLGLLLSVLGHQVRVVYDGPTALQAASSFQPQLVFLDIGLPGMDGYEVAQRLRRQSGLRDVCLIAATGFGQEAERRRCLEEGFDHFLLKPFDPTELEALLAAKSARRVVRVEPASGR